MRKKLILFSVLALSVFFISSLVSAENITKGPLDWPMAPGGPRVQLSKSNWGFTYTKDNNWFADVNGKTYGPYENVFVSVSDNFWGIKYTEIGGKSFVNINEKIYGPYENARVTTSNNNWLIEYKEGEKWYANINEKIFGPCDSPYGFSIGEVSLADNDWAFECKKSNKFFAVVNGKEYGPYDNIHDIFTSNNYWQFRYAEDGKEFLNINGEVQSITGESFMSSDNQGFVYGSSDKRSINIKGNVFGSYDYIQSSVISDSKWGFEYGNKHDERNEAYVNINNKIYGPYDTVYGLDIAGDNFGFKYSKDKKAFMVINDEEYGPYDFGNVSVSEKSWGFSYSKEGKTYVNFIGTEYGPFDNKYQVIYVSDNNWMMNDSIDDYFSQGPKSAIINGDVFGPYEVAEAFLGSDRWAYNYQKEGKWYVVISQYVATDDNKVNDAAIVSQDTSNQSDQEDKLSKDNQSGETQINFKYWMAILLGVVVLIALFGSIGYLIYKKKKKNSADATNL